MNFFLFSLVNLPGALAIRVGILPITVGSRG